MIVDEKIDEIISKIYKCPNRSLSFSDNNQTYLRKCIPFIKKEGMWAEFGVYRGKTIQFIASFTDKPVYGFDSFDGLHEHWDKDNPKGVYSLGGVIPKGAIDLSRQDSNPGMYSSAETYHIVPWLPNIKLYKGYFDESLPKFLEEHKEEAAFLHIDSDLYSSCKIILELFETRITKDTILCFDDFPGYPMFSDRNHEIKAFAEFLLKTNHAYDILVLQPGRDYSQVCFIIKD